MLSLETKKNIMKYLSTLILLIIFCFSATAQKKDTKIKVRKIWDKAPHSAFTDLIRYKGNFYCTFREGVGHVSGPGGTARVLKSKNGKTWKSMKSFSMSGLDVRDPKISITPDNRLMVLMDVETYKDGKVETRKPFVSYSNDGVNYTEPFASAVDPAIAVKSDWVWRVTWNKGVGYAVDYQPGKAFLMKTLDGKAFQNISQIDIDGGPNESTIRFDKNDKIYIVIRRDQGDKMGVIATADAPYTNFKFSKMTERIGGPNFVFLDDNTLCIGSRLYVPNPPDAAKEYKDYRTALFITDLNGKIKETIIIPESGGDTSYPGMLIYKHKLWMSYYSSHEGKGSIYLAKIAIKTLQDD